MSRFDSVEELRVFLGNLDRDYTQYADTLWPKSIKTAYQLAYANKPDLVSWGLLGVHVDAIKARALNPGGSPRSAGGSFEARPSRPRSPSGSPSKPDSSNSQKTHALSDDAFVLRDVFKGISAAYNLNYAGSLGLWSSDQKVPIADASGLTVIASRSMELQIHAIDPDTETAYIVGAAFRHKINQVEKEALAMWCTNALSGIFKDVTIFLSDGRDGARFTYHSDMTEYRDRMPISKIKGHFTASSSFRLFDKHYIPHDLESPAALALLVETISPQHLNCKDTVLKEAFDKLDAEAASALQQKLTAFTTNAQELATKRKLEENDDKARKAGRFESAAGFMVNN
ncbi:hypothetical protein WJX72_000170 [[Myrmecia] bisecta]|uniref:Uncharacterized protein n=1 Tax=[Myrmecia] bisecta TaxID=41462 RepID=A0AAW1PDD7_9CHLO